jgi:DNA end-binding protein Ku
MMAMKFEPEAFKDEYKKALMELVEAKVEKRQIIEAPEPEAETTVVDLMSALKASVEKAKKGEIAHGRESRGGRESLASGKKTTAREKSARKKAS